MKMKIIVTVFGLLLTFFLRAQPNIYTDGKLTVNNEAPSYDLDVYSPNADPGIIVSSAIGGDVSALQLCTTRPDPTQRLRGAAAGSGNKGWMLDAVHDNHSAVSARNHFRISYFNNENWITPFEINPTGLALFRFETHARGGMRINDHAHFFSNSANSDNWITSYDENANRKWVLNMLDSSDDDAFRIYSDDISQYVFTLRPSGNLELAGKVTIQGSDFSENFTISDTEGKLIQAGTLLSIDPLSEAKLTPTKKAYDKSVAGIISGAKGINTGMVMGQQGTLADGDTPVAISGRVYVLADATKHAITPGDLLTSSNTEGHVQKVKNHRKSKGAIMGKALTSLPKGKLGFVLVLVNLQ